MKILIVEDDRDLALAMSEYLSLYEIVCDFAFNGVSGVALAEEQRFDAVILDNMLPKMNGMDACKALRARSNNTPILMLTASDTDAEQLEGFRSGVDDYVTKPCSMPLLLARLKAIHRRHRPERESITISDLVIYPKEYKASRAGDELKLTPTSWKILLYLAHRSPEVVARLDIEEALWPDDDVEEGRFNVHLHQLRKALDKPYEQALIRTHVGVGLSLCEVQG